MSKETRNTKNIDIRDAIRNSIDHLAHILPAQAPLKDFVHHNTLHGFQHLPFPQALSEARKVSGAYGYLPQEEFRRLYAQGRITDQDLEQVLLQDTDLAGAESIAGFDAVQLRRVDIYRTAMVFPLKTVTNTQLNWQIEERNALRSFQPDVTQQSRARLLKQSGAHGLTDEPTAIRNLWSACLETLGLKHFVLHPEELLDLGQEQAERIFSELTVSTDERDTGKPMMHRLVRKEAERTLQQLIDKVGTEITMCGFLQQLTGNHLIDEIRPILIRHISAYLDHGLCAWNNIDRNKGFYAAWRSSAVNDLAWGFDDLEWAREELSILPEDSLDAVIGELQRLGLARNRWPQYVERLALEIPGWSGMFYWRHSNPEYEGLAPDKVQMMDYLAVLLVFERLTAQRLCGNHWQLEPRLDVLQGYFRRHRSEFIVRFLLFNGRLPEYLISPAQRLVGRRLSQRADYRDWILLADRIWTWRHSPAADRPIGYSVFRSGWRLFRLAQHLGLCGAEIRILEKPQIDRIFNCLDRLNEENTGFLWLQAYEHNYREQLLNAVANNTGRGRWPARETRPDAQVVFCMDDREEGIRRHLEELNPNIETMGAAGFFGVAINWKGLDDERVTPLCPIVVTPSHEVRETVPAGQEQRQAIHNKRRKIRLQGLNMLHQELRRNLISTALLISLLSPLYLLALIAEIISPRLFGRLAQTLRRRFDIPVDTEVNISTSNENAPATPEQPRLGFTDHEQADRVQNFLRTIGLTSGFGSFVVMMGHGSSSQNNPHLSAYDCGACSGRHGGPNARVFAAMANRPQIRRQLSERGMVIPEDTWFLGAEHNTCDDSITWYDQDAVPDTLHTQFVRLKSHLQTAGEKSAHERCRRFASAPKSPSPIQALKHVIGRSYDFSQARPELGHATNAAAFIGRRSISQGAFFDRRVFLISYDPTYDPQGTLLEAILLAAGPVGAGINLEYYFSTVNNEQYGCGSKIMHNVIGLFGVMEGTSSDLRTGLPKQMIEIHEAMRLQILVEASNEVLTEIYQRQPVLQELIGNGWVHLMAKHPDNDDISLFKPGIGFVPWQGQITELPKVKHSTDWYAGHSDPRPFALIEEASHG